MNDDLIRLGLIDDDEIELDAAALLLAAVDRTDVDLESHYELIEAIVLRLEEADGETADASERAEALSRVLAAEFGFAGDEATYDDPANADLIDVIDRRRGLPVSLAILYVAAARRQGWQADVLDLPGHVLVLVGGDTDPVMIDPFHRGARVDPQGLLAFLGTADAAPAPTVRQVQTMSNRAILRRLLCNQATRAENSGRTVRALMLYRRITMIAPGHPQSWWDRARLELVLGDITDARASLSALLETTREPVLRRQVGEMLAALTRA